MKISAVSYNLPKLAFGDALSSKQEKQLNALMDRIKTKESERRQSYGDYTAPMNLAYLYPYALPNKPNSFDDGVGKINSPMAKRYYEIMKTYGGANAIQLPPLTQLTDVEVYNKNHSASPYKGSGLALSEAIIHIPNLMTEEYGCILSKEDVKEYIDTHKDNIQEQLGAIKSQYTNNKIDPEAFIDLQTPLGWKNQEDYPINNVLRKAYHNLMSGNNGNYKAIELKEEFENFKNQKEPINYSKIYTRLALFPYIKDWATSKTDFFVGFDSNDYDKHMKRKEIQKWWDEQDKNRQREILEAIDFYKFKQFICRKELKAAVDTIHSLGMEVYGDVLFGNSWVEEQVFPDAFKKRADGARAEIGDLGGLPAYNFEDLRDNPYGAASKYLKQKIAFNLDYFDGIRLDMGWEYIRPHFHFNHQYQDVWVDTKITDKIASWAKEIKGDDFDTRKLMYECDADGRDFSIEGFADLMKRTQGTMVLSTVNEKEDNGSFGSLAYYKENLGFDDDKIIITANTHDEGGVIEYADNAAKCSANAGALERTYRKRECDGVKDGWKMFKSDTDPDENRRLYVKARLAEADLAKNNMITYLNLLGRRERLDYHNDGSLAGGFESAINYKNRLQRKSEEWFHDALRASVAFNLPEIKLFNIKNAPRGVNYNQEDIEALEKYAKYLKRNTGINSKEQADKSEMADVDISKMNLDEI